MSKDFEQILKEISKQNKDLNSIDAAISKEVLKDLESIKKTVKTIDERSKRMEATIDSLFELINSITIFIEDEGVLDDEPEENETWTPYSNYDYDDNDEENIGGDSYWSSNEDDD